MSVAHYIRSNLTIPLQQAAKLLYGMDICSKCNKAIVFLDGAPWHKLPQHGPANEKCCEQSK